MTDADRISAESKWLTFLPHDPITRAPRRTLIWLVVAKASGGTLGEVRWYGPWRQYAFFPEPGIVLAGSCFTDLAAFILAVRRARA